MLYSAAILVQPPHEELLKGAPRESVLYGPVAVLSSDHDYQGAAYRVIAEASAAGKLPNGWDEQRMRVVALQYSSISNC